MANQTSSKQDFLKTQLEVENDLLHQKLHCLTAEEHSSSTVCIQAKLKAFKLEEERDRMYERLEKIKRKYNQLHEAYLQKVRSCKALEDVFNRQKTLNGLVMKSAINQSRKERNFAGRQDSKRGEEQTIASSEAQLGELQAALHEADDIIDELEFELESVDFLEEENKYLRNELKTYKQEKETANENYDEQPEYRQGDKVTSNYNIDSNASSLADSILGDLDPATLERSVLTESLIKMAESESNYLRRELLRSRLQKASRPSVRPTSSDA